MILLAIETTTSSGSISVLKNDKIVYQDFADLSITHSETIMVRINKALETLKIKKEELTGLCVSSGPGSYTGLRIGLATAKGLAIGLKIPLIGLNTMEILASNVYGTEKNILTVLDARMNEVYMTIFDKELNIITDTHCRKYENITEGLQGNYICVGDTHLINNPENFAFALPHQNVLFAAAQFSLLKIKNIELKYNEEYISLLEPNYIKNIEKN